MNCAICEEEMRQLNNVMCICGKHYCNECILKMAKKIMYDNPNA